MGAKQIGWPLKGEWFYLTRERASETIFAAAKYVARKEHQGWTLEGFCLNASPPGDGYPASYSAHILMQDAGEPPEDYPAPDHSMNIDCCCVRCLPGRDAA